MERTIVYLIRHSEQLKIKEKNIKEESQINNEKIILSVKGNMAIQKNMFIL